MIPLTLQNTFYRVAVMLILSCSVFTTLQAQGETYEADRAFYRASKIYEYGRNHKDYYESRSALKTAERSFRNFLRNHPGHAERQKAYYRMAVAQLLTGNLESAEANFAFIIDKYRRGQLVAASAYRLGAQRYNEKLYGKAERHFRIAAQESKKPALRHQALYQQARCLMLSGAKKSALTPLRNLMKEESAYQDTGRLALAHILYELNEYEEALSHFEVLQKKIGLGENVKVEARLYTGLTYAKLGRKKEALEIISETIDTPGLKSEFKAKAQNELFTMYFDNQQIDELIEIDNIDGVERRVFIENELTWNNIIITLWKIKITQ